VKLASISSLILCSFCPATSQDMHGTIGIVYYTPDRIVAVAESRLTPGGPVGVPTDDGCKVAALGGSMVFVSGGVTGHLRDAFLDAWDSNGLMRAAYSRVKSGNPQQHRRLTQMAREWSNAVADRLNADSRLQPGLLLKLRDMLGGPGASFTSGYLGGLDDAGNLTLLLMQATPNAFATLAEGRVEHMSACPFRGFCVLGSARDLEVVREFASASSERARRETAEWKPPKGAQPKDYDAFKTIRMLV
jgi:hypothetical protein